MVVKFETPDEADRAANREFITAQVEATREALRLAGALGEQVSGLDERLGQVGPQVAALGEKVTAIDERLGQVGPQVAALVREIEGVGARVDASEAHGLAAIHELMAGIEALSEAPPAVSIDEEQVRRIARKTARTVAAETAAQAVAAMQTLANEIVERDDEGRALVVERMLANGQALRYRLVRDTGGRLAGLARIETAADSGQGES